MCKDTNSFSFFLLIILYTNNYVWYKLNIKIEFYYSYEPELHPGVTYKLKVPKATLKIFSTGSVTVTGKFKWK